MTRFSVEDALRGPGPRRPVHLAPVLLVWLAILGVSFLAFPWGPGVVAGVTLWLLLLTLAWR